MMITILTAQEQAIRTNYSRVKSEKDGTPLTCRMYKKANETISYRVSECGKLVQQEYKGKHDRVATAMDWCLARKFSFSANNQ